MIESELKQNEESGATGGTLPTTMAPDGSVPPERPSRAEWFEGVFSAAADAILVHGQDGRFIEVNPAACQFLGYTRQELLAMHVWEVMASASLQDMLTLWQEPQPGVAVTVERTCRRKDASLVVAEVRLTRFQSAGRDGMILACRDVKERRRAEDQVRERERSLAEGQRLTHTGSWTWDLVNDLLLWSSETFRIFGYDESGPSPGYEGLLRERVHAEDRAALQRAVETLRHQSWPVTLRYRIVLPDGTVKHLESIARSVMDERGAAVKLVGTVMDVTERQNVEQALRASEQLTRGHVEALTQALDTLAEASALDELLGHVLHTMNRQLGVQGVSLWLREEASDLVGFHLSVEQGGTLPRPEADPAGAGSAPRWLDSPVAQEIARTRKPIVWDDIEGDPRLAPYRNYLMALGLRTLLAVPLLVSGRVIGLISLGTTGRRRFRAEEIELAQALAHQATLAIHLSRLAEQSRRAAVLEERNRLARDIHDTLAQGFTGIIVQLEAGRDAMVKGQGKEARRHLERAGELARQSLGEARRSVQALRPLVLTEKTLPSALAGLIQQMTPGTGIEVEFTLDGEQRRLPPAWEENLLRIGQEAVTNTLKHARATRFQARLAFGLEELRLEFHDNGRGFKAPHRNGGFGLTGMKERVEQMGGQLAIRSAVGTGTSVLVVVPVAPAFREVSP